MRYRRAYLEVSLSAIVHNLRQYRQEIPEHAAMMAVVKADGYGHGAIPVLKKAIEAGVTWAGVALIEEAIELRNAGIEIPILLLGSWFPEALPAFSQYGITPVVHSLDSAQGLQDYAKRQNLRIKIHIKLDTGMGRLGFCEKSLVEFLTHFSNYDHLIIDGVMTHFSSADEGVESFSQEQVRKFNQALSLVKRWHHPTWIHLANTAGITEVSGTRGNLFRVGIGMYGQPPSACLVNPVQLREAITWKAGIIQLQQHPAHVPLSYGRTFYTQRPSQIATVCVGYADGYSRRLSNEFYALVRGQKVPIVGNVCMDMFLLDVTNVPGVEVNDEVILIGQQQGLSITASEMAEQLQTINYEITCRISKRIPRIYT
ncbi:MAG: alanine racemase [SAR324 cluster bacterium]|uniref:Alanine racemase n=1 Tax=SAR324 cluster bacterium TaxID=2024889 RepID=A0A2A4T1H1_9DELT|nr:MAG: alanine racemase [SAR324 cluster bacterium]